jgi:hypothetical protein
MDGTERVTQLRQSHKNDAQSDEIVIREEAEAAARQRREAQFVTPVPVSRSSYLYEMDRHYRAAMTAENSGDLAERAVNRLLRLDRLAQEAALNGASQRAQANIERLIEVLGHTTGMLVFDFSSSSQD